MGLALAGGGFRASLFHIGALRRIAELDLLRHVEILSCVSGGAIVGALYTLALKRAFERCGSGGITKLDYLEIVDSVERRLLDGIRKDIRTRLLRNPLRVLWMIVSWSGLGAHLATLIDRHFLGASRWPWKRNAASIRLKHARVGPEAIDADAHNESVLGGVTKLVAAGARSATAVLPAAYTKLVINATCLNSGDRFWLSHDEIGDWRLGHFAADEIDRLARVKPLWTCNEDALVAACESARDPGLAVMNSVEYSFRELWTVARLRSVGAGAPPAEWAAAEKSGVFERLGALEDLGYLRAAKNAAKLLGRNAADAKVLAAAADRFRHALVAIDDAMADDLAPPGGKTVPQPSWSNAYGLVEEIYIARMAHCASRTVKDDFDNWTLARAVAASANFPPVLPPYKVAGLFDDWYVSRLGLTDGGVFENSGVQALIDEDCTCLIVSDPGSPFSTRRRSSVGRVWMMHRIVDTIMTGISWRQRAHVDTLWTTGEIDTYAWIDIDGPSRKPRDGGPVLKTTLDGHAVARLRTDLDAFGEVEIAALINHGYDRADRYLRRYVVDEGDFKAVADVATPPLLPCTLSEDTERIDRILWAGRKRFAKSLLVPPPWAQALAVGAGATVAFLTWWLGGIRVWWMGPWMLTLARQHPTLASVIGYHAGTWEIAFVGGLFATALALEWVNAPGFVLKTWRHRAWVIRLPLGLITDRVRGLSFNLLWLVPPFPLPIWIAVTVWLAACLKYVLITLPFRWMTRP